MPNSKDRKEPRPGTNGFPHAGYPYQRLTVPHSAAEDVQRALRWYANILLSSEGAARLRRIADQLK